MKDRPTTNSPLSGRTLLIGLVVVVAALFLIPRLFNTNTTTPIQPTSQPQSDVDSQTEFDPNVTLGQLVSAGNVDRDGCPTDARTSFETNEAIFVVAPGSDMPSGTNVFARLYRDGDPIEDAPEIVADRDYTNSCVYFTFEPDGSAFEPGQYEAEFIINGNPADTIQFSVR